MDIQKLLDSISKAGEIERSKYHITFGGLIDKLKQAKDTDIFSPKIVGISSYRGYYSDIALCTESGSYASKTTTENYTLENYDKMCEENEVKIDFSGTPKELANKLETIIGMYFTGYKGGDFQITKDKPLWLATDSGNCSDLAIVEITDSLKLITKQMD